MKQKLKKIMKSKKSIVMIIFIIILVICLFLMKGIFFPNSGSKYGNRLNGIEKVPFETKTQSEILDSLEKNEKVLDEKINIHGKIINVIFDVDENTSIDNAKEVSNNLLSKFSDDIKNFYDIQFIITKNSEKGTEKEVTDENGKTTTTTVKEFPIMGYKNSKSKEIVW